MDNIEQYKATDAPDTERKLLMKRENRYTISYRTMFVILLLLALIVPSQAANAALEGTLTIQRFRVEDYENLRESTGQSSDIANVPSGAQSLEGVTYQVEKLQVASTDTQVTTATAVDASFPLQVGVTNAGGEATFSDLPEGYYLVRERTPSGHTTHTSAFVVQIPHTIVDADGNETTNYRVVVYPKGQQVQVEKNVSSTKQVVGIGDIISWDVWYPMGPDLKREETINGVTTTSYGKNFYLTDEMDTRLDYVSGSVTFRYYDRNEEEINLTLTEGTDYNLIYDETTHILTISFTDNVGTKKVADANVGFIRMHLDTSVNASALETIEVLWNNARISFENHSGDPYEHEVFPPGTNPEDSRVPKVHLGQIAVTKVDAQDKAVRLAGATFYLAETLQDAQAGKFLTRVSDTNGAREEIRITTDNNGQATIKAIGAGTYYLVETQAPEGYNKLTEPIEITVANDGRNNVVQVEITNLKDGSAPVDPGKPGDGDPGDGKPGTPGDDTPGADTPGGKDFAGGVKTGDVVRMTGILLLAIASGGIVFVILRREKEKRAEAV